MKNYFKDLLVLIVIVVLQSTFIPLISVNNVAPDLVLIFVVTVAIKSGQIPATVLGFIGGAVLDLLTGEFFGLGAFTKTISGFMIGYLFNENKIDSILKSYQYLMLVAIASLINNILYFAIYTQGTSITFFSAIFEIGFFSSIYTSVITFFPMIYFQRKRVSF